MNQGGMARSVRIQHNGQQLGPYSVEEAQRMVLAGEIPPSTVSEIDNSGDWRPLHQHPEFVARPVSSQPVAPVFAAPVAVPVASAAPVAAVPASAAPVATAPVTAAEEKTIWEGSPSQTLNFKVIAGWILVLGLVGGALYFLDRMPAWTDKVTRQQAMMGFGALAAVALVHYLGAALSLRSTHYLVTNQRVRVTRGLLGKNMQEIESFLASGRHGGQADFFRRLCSGWVTSRLSAATPTIRICIWSRCRRRSSCVRASGAKSSRCASVSACASWMSCGARWRARNDEIRRTKPERNGRAEGELVERDLRAR